jgi:hypothetical protein
MFAVLTSASVVVCAHQAPVVIQPSQRLLTVDGQPVLLRADLLAATIPDCPSNTPCGKVSSILSGLSKTLNVGGEPVVLANAHGLSATPAQWRVQAANQTKLEAA